MNILTAIKNALMSAFRSIGRGLAAVFRVLPFGGGGGNGPIEPPQIADEVEELQPTVRPSSCSVADAFLDAMADHAITWAANSIVDDAPAPLPDDLDPALREWLPGLTREQCEALISRTPLEVAAHLRGPWPIPGVPKLQRLQPLGRWPAPAGTVPADVVDDVELSVSPRLA